MKILVINCGSSSLKYQLINMENEGVLAQGLVERIGIEGSILTQKVNGEKYIIKEPMENHKDAIKLVLEALVDEKHGVIKNMDEISAVGHRVVHGGEKYSKSVLVDEDVMAYLEECVKLAPLHNRPNIIGIEACKALMPNTPMAVVFDTAFHGTMPKEAYSYALPYELYKENGIRKYGFHGTSHKYVSGKVAEVLGKDIKDLKIVTCHLGNGVSLTAVKLYNTSFSPALVTSVNSPSMLSPSESPLASITYLISLSFPANDGVSTVTLALSEYTTPLITSCACI